MLRHSLPLWGGGGGRGVGCVWAGLEFMVNTIQCVLNEGERRLVCSLAGAEQIRRYQHEIRWCVCACVYACCVCVCVCMLEPFWQHFQSVVPCSSKVNRKIPCCRVDVCRLFLIKILADVTARVRPVAPAVELHPSHSLTGRSCSSFRPRATSRMQLSSARGVSGVNAIMSEIGLMWL